MAQITMITQKMIMLYLAARGSCNLRSLQRRTGKLQQGWVQKLMIMAQFKVLKTQKKIKNIQVLLIYKGPILCKKMAVLLIKLSLA